MFFCKKIKNIELFLQKVYKIRKISLKKEKDIK